MIRITDLIVVAGLPILLCLCISGLERAQQNRALQMAEAGR